MKPLPLIIAASVLTAAGALAATVRHTARANNDARLAAQARISADSARTLALAAIPGGRIVEAELEEEGGKLVYSYDIELVGKRGVEELHIDAINGTLLSRVHESDDDEESEQEPQAVNSDVKRSATP